MVFESERLAVRYITPEDFASFHEMQSSERVMKYILGRPKTQEENEQEMKRILASYEKQEGNFLVLAAVRKCDGQFIGTCAVIKNQDGEHEIGFRLLERYWGNGFGREICRSLIRYCFFDLGLRSVAAYVEKENIASIRTLEKAGMEYVSERIEPDSGVPVRYYRLDKPE